MSDRLFGFDTTTLGLKVPKAANIEADMEKMFGPLGFQASLGFSLTQDA